MASESGIPNQWLYARADYQEFVARAAVAEEAAKSTIVSDLLTAAFKAPPKRTTRDLVLIAKYLQTKSFAEGLEKRDVEQLAEAVLGVSIPPRGVVCRQGETGEHFYVILRGQLSVSVQGVGVVAVLREGDTFGELSLTSTGTRQATVASDSPNQAVLLLSLFKSDYDAVVKMQHTANLGATATFLSEIEAFAGWSRNRLRRLAMALNPRVLRRGEVFVRQGDAVDKVLIIRKGTMQCSHSATVEVSSRWPASQVSAAATATAAAAAAHTPTVTSAAHDPRSTSPQRRLSITTTAATHATKAGALSDLSMAASSAVVGAASTLHEHGEDAVRVGLLHDAYRKVVKVVSESEGVDLTSSRLPLGYRVTTLAFDETVGVLSTGTAYGLPLVAFNIPHPFTITAWDDSCVLLLDRKYLVENDLAAADCTEVTRKQMFYPGGKQQVHLPGSVSVIPLLPASVPAARRSSSSTALSRIYDGAEASSSSDAFEWGVDAGASLCARLRNVGVIAYPQAAAYMRRLQQRATYESKSRSLFASSVHGLNTIASVLSTSVGAGEQGGEPHPGSEEADAAAMGAGRQSRRRASCDSVAAGPSAAAVSSPLATVTAAPGRRLLPEGGAAVRAPAAAPPHCPSFDEAIMERRREALQCLVALDTSACKRVLRIMMSAVASASVPGTGCDSEQPTTARR